MTTPLPRKTCSCCGNECLLDDLNCWACGELLAPRSRARAAMPTLIGAAAAPAGALSRFRRALRPLGTPGNRRRWLWIALLALVLGAGARVAGLWYGAGEAPAADSPSLLPLRVESSPAPRNETAPAPILGEAGSGGANNSGGPTALPSRESRTNLFPGERLHARLRGRLRRPEPPHLMLPHRFPGQRLVAPLSGFGDRADPFGRAPAPAPFFPLPPPPDRASGDIFVTIRNSTSAPLDFDFGPHQLSGVVAAHAQLDAPVPNGTYTVILQGAGRREVLYDVEIGRGRSYELLFDAQHARMHTMP